jgi:hypothetical protein
MLLWPTSDIPFFQPRSPVERRYVLGVDFGVNTLCLGMEYIVIP